MAATSLSMMALAITVLPVLAGFQPPQSFPTGPCPFSVAVGDFNRDNNPDVVVANLCNSSNSVSVLLGNGNGTLQGQVTYATGVNPFSVAVGDFNGDNNPDLVVANADSSTNVVSVLLGNGNGTFQPQQTYPAWTAPGYVTVADLNGDGKSDLAVAGNFSFNFVGSVSVLLGNGNGTFQPEKTFPVQGSAASVAAGDLNGDGKPDLAMANMGNGNAGSVTVMLGNGDGTFQQQQDFPTGASAFSAAIADFNRDGKPDVVVANFASTVSVLLGNGNGTFQSRQTITTGVGSRSVVVADLDGDNKVDLAVANQLSNTVSVLLGNGDGTFQAQQAYPTGQGPASVALGDFNRDSRLDLAVANQSNNTVSVLLSDPLPCTPRPRVVTSLAAGGGALQVHVQPTPLNTQSTNSIQQLHFGVFQNATVTLNGQSVTNGQTVTLPANTAAADFTVRRVTAGQPTTVQLTIVDACGGWKTFVGGGANAGF